MQKILILHKTIKSIKKKLQHGTALDVSVCSSHNPETLRIKRKMSTKTCDPHFNSCGKQKEKKNPTFFYC